MGAEGQRGVAEIGNWHLDESENPEVHASDDRSGFASRSAPTETHADKTGLMNDTEAIFKQEFGIRD